MLREWTYTASSRDALGNTSLLSAVYGYNLFFSPLPTTEQKLTQNVNIGRIAVAPSDDFTGINNSSAPSEDQIAFQNVFNQSAKTNRRISNVFAWRPFSLRQPCLVFRFQLASDICKGLHCDVNMNESCDLKFLPSWMLVQDRYSAAQRWSIQQFRAFEEFSSFGAFEEMHFPGHSTICIGAFLSFVLIHVCAVLYFLYVVFDIGLGSVFHYYCIKDSAVSGPLKKCTFLGIHQSVLERFSALSQIHVCTVLYLSMLCLIKYIFQLDWDQDFITNASKIQQFRGL